MARKRYIKLLMAGEMSRNVANGVARYTRNVLGCSYRDAAACNERAYRDMAQHIAALFLRVRWQRSADILHRALYGEVAHE